MNEPGVLVPTARVAVFAAMVPELRPVVRGCSLRRVRLGARDVFEGKAGGHDVVAAVTSMGTRAATQVTDAVLDAYGVDHVLVVGIAGGIAPQVALGDLIVPEVVVDEASGEEVHPTPLGQRAAGRLLTTDVLHNTAAELAELVRAGFLAVDMETAAIGAVCERRGIPWSVFRGVSDRAGDPSVDADVVGLAKADGSANLRAVVRFVVTRPWRLPTLVRLGHGMTRAVRVSTDPALRALGAG